MRSLNGWQPERPSKKYGRMLENMAFYRCEMDHSRNKTRFECVKLIFDPENKRISPKKQETESAKITRRFARSSGDNRKFAYIFGKKTVSKKAEIFRIFPHESITHGSPVILAAQLLFVFLCYAKNSPFCFRPFPEIAVLEKRRRRGAVLSSKK